MKQKSIIDLQAATKTTRNVRSSKKKRKESGMEHALLKFMKFHRIRYLIKIEITRISSRDHVNDQYFYYLPLETL